jgi:hypothetical protein
MLFKALVTAACASCALAHANHDQTPIEGPHRSLWYNTLPGDGGTQVRRSENMLERRLILSRPTLSFQASRLSAVCPTSHVSPAIMRNMTLHSSVRTRPRSFTDNTDSQQALHSTRVHRTVPVLASGPAGFVKVLDVSIFSTSLCKILLLIHVCSKAHERSDSAEDTTCKS